MQTIKSVIRLVQCFNKNACTSTPTNFEVIYTTPSNSVTNNKQFISINIHMTHSFKDGLSRLTLPAELILWKVQRDTIRKCQRIKSNKTITPFSSLI